MPQPTKTTGPQKTLSPDITHLTMHLATVLIVFTTTMATTAAQTSQPPTYRAPQPNTPGTAYPATSPYAPHVTAPHVSYSSQLSQPDFILMRPLDSEIRRQLTEDLQILDNLLTRAVAGATGPEGLYRQALGVRVALAPDSDSRIRYIQNYGAIFTYHVNIPVAEQKPQETARTATPRKPETEWERTRRLLFNPRPVQALTAHGTTDGSSGFEDVQIFAQTAPYNADVVSSVREGVKDALKNVTQIRCLGGTVPDPGLDVFSPGESSGYTVVVILKSQADGSVMTFATNREAWEGDKPEDAVKVHQFFAPKPTGPPAGYIKIEKYVPVPDASGFPGQWQPIPVEDPMAGPQPFSPSPSGTNPFAPRTIDPTEPIQNPGDDFRLPEPKPEKEMPKT